MSVSIVVLSGLFLVQGNGTAPRANFQDFLTAFSPGLTALTGVVTILILAWKNQSDVYKDRIEQYKGAFEQYKGAFDRNLESVKSSHDAEERSLQLLLKQKELDIKKLKTRIKRLENFYEISFSNLEKKDDVLEKLILFLTYADRRVQDGIFSQEVQKVKDYLKSHLGLVDRQMLRFEAARWLDINIDDLVNLATKYIASESSDTLTIESQGEIKQSIEQYLKRLRLMLNAGVGTESNPDFIEKTRLRCDPKYVKALVYIKDYQIGGQISHDAHEELEQCMDDLKKIIS